MLAKIGNPGRGSVVRGARSRRRNAWRAAAVCVSAVAIVSAAACSSSSSSSASAGSSASAVSSASGSAQGANVAAAKAALAPYEVAPTTFPLTGPLPEKLPAGKKFVFLQCGTPVCTGIGLFVRQAVKTIGGTITVLNAGSTAQTATAAAASALALKPAAVLVGGIDPALFGGGFKALTAAGVKVVSIQVTEDVAPFGITFNYLGANLSQRNGKLLADWVIADKGAQANAVLYTLPGLDVSAPMQSAFEAEMKANCSSCKVRIVPIDLATIGTTAPATVVTDLQAHPTTNVAVFVGLETTAGLPAALKAAGLKITTVGFGPTAGNLQDIKDGALTAGLAIDFPMSVWTAVDAAARLLEGAQPTASEQAGDVPEQFLEQKDITFNPTLGWSAFPDYAQRFAQLWHVS
jgi:ribose transport system substrate-binding protein